MQNNPLPVSPPIHDALPALIDGFLFYVLLIDENHNIILVNKAVSEHLQVELQVLIGKYCPEIIHGMKTPFPGCPLAEVVETGQPAEKEFFDEPRKVWLQSLVYPTILTTAEGKRIYVHFTRDITERLKRGQEIEDNEVRFHELFNTMSSGCLILHSEQNGKDFIVNDINGAMEKMEGVPGKEIIGRRISEVYPRIKEFGIWPM